MSKLTPEECCKKADASAESGWKYWSEGDSDKAMEYCTQAIELNELCRVAYSVRGNIYRERGNDDLAEADFVNAKRIKEGRMPAKRCQTQLI